MYNEEKSIRMITSTGNSTPNNSAKYKRIEWKRKKSTDEDTNRSFTDFEGSFSGNWRTSKTSTPLNQNRRVVVLNSSTSTPKQPHRKPNFESSSKRDSSIMRDTSLQEKIDTIRTKHFERGNWKKVASESFSYRRKSPEVEDAHSRSMTDIHSRIGKRGFNVSVEEKLDNFKKLKLNFDPKNDSSIAPKFRSFQLMGDSQFVRFARQVLNYENDYSRQIQYCVSGQTIGDLLKQVKNKEYSIDQNVIMMIGTNDMIRWHTDKEMENAYRMLVDLLSAQTERLVLVSVPPVPKYENNPYHFVKLTQFNKFIRSLADGEKVFFVNIYDKFFYAKNKVKLQYFEKTYGRSTKVDLIHLNYKGFKVLESVLHAEYDNWNSE